MAEAGGNRKIRHSLVALGSAAVLAVYTAGYERTRTAAERLALQAGERRPVVPAPVAAVAPATPETITDAAGRPPRDADGPLTDVRPSSEIPAGAERRTVTSRDESSPRSPRSEVATPAPVSSAAATPVDASPAASVPSAIVSEAGDPASAPSAERVEAVSATPAVTASAPGSSVALFKDGTYSGWGSCRHGTIEATVTILAGRIESARISQCRTRYSCSWIDALPGQVVARQSPEVDYVSGATQSVDAFYYAVVEALSKAK